MGKIEPPFLYDPPSLYPKSAQVADFNPKAVTLNSWAPRPQKPKKDGPLVNFNQHPDNPCYLGCRVVDTDNAEEHSHNPDEG